MEAPQAFHAATSVGTIFGTKSQSQSERTASSSILRRVATWFALPVRPCPGRERLAAAITSLCRGWRWRDDAACDAVFARMSSRRREGGRKDDLRSRSSREGQTLHPPPITGVVIPRLHHTGCTRNTRKSVTPRGHGQAGCTGTTAKSGSPRGQSQGREVPLRGEIPHGTEDVFQRATQKRKGTGPPLRF